MPSQINQKTVAKNTLMLYIRMGVMMIVSLYTSRVVLATLGVDDFGIYNVVGGVVVMFSFMNITLTVTIRRFLAFELGKNNGDNISSVFNASIIAVLFASVIMVVVLETFGVWFLNNKLNIPFIRMDSANFVFQLTIVTFFLNMNMVPFSSAIVVYEKMGVYAYFGIIETMLKLCLILCLPYFPGDKLRLYGLILLFISLFVVLGNYFYCTRRVLPIRFLLNFRWKVVSDIFSFSAWSILGSIIYMLATQGLNIIFNIFYGVAINAALGVSHQAANSIKQFIDNFQTAFNPQLTKSYSAEKLSSNTFHFVCQTSKLSIVLVSIIGVPIIANISHLLTLWLGVVPDYAVPFSVIFVLYTAIDGVSGPLFMLVYAKGDVKLYQIVLSAIQLLYIVLVYVLCSLGFNPVFVLSMIVISAALLYIARLCVLKRIMNFPVFKFSRKVITPFSILFVMFVGIIFINTTIELKSVFEVISSVFVLFAISTLGCYYLYLDESERKFIISLVKKQNV